MHYSSPFRSAFPHASDIADGKLDVYGQLDSNYVQQSAPHMRAIGRMIKTARPLRQNLSTVSHDPGLVSFITRFSALCLHYPTTKGKLGVPSMHGGVPSMHGGVPSMHGGYQACMGMRVSQCPCLSRAEWRARDPMACPIRDCRCSACPSRSPPPHRPRHRRPRSTALPRQHTACVPAHRPPRCAAAVRGLVRSDRSGWRSTATSTFFLSFFFHFWTISR